jgi:hypothetical protein
MTMKSRPMVTVLLWFICLPILLAGCTNSPGEVDTPGEGNSDELAARAALIAFFDHLHTGEYAAAADLYGGSYETMIAHNPSIDPSDHAALLRAACTLNGAQCLKVASAALQESGDADAVIVYSVEFLREDGSIFTRGPCCGEAGEEGGARQDFTIRVRKEAGSLFRILDPPIYTP